jgi:hypothetical protein
VFNERLEIRAGRMLVPTRPGLGVSLSAQARAWTPEQVERSAATSPPHDPPMRRTPQVDALHEGQHRAAQRQDRRVARTGDHQHPNARPCCPTCRRWTKLGLKGVAVFFWQAVAAPKGLPADIEAKLRDAIVAGLNDLAVKPKLLERGFEIAGNTPEQFTSFQAAEFARQKNVIEVGTITAD